MLFVTLLSPKGKGAEAVSYLKKLKPPRSITINAVYFTFGCYDGMIVFDAPDVKTATFGCYDGMIVFDAPDVKTAMNFVMETAFATDYTVETLTAIPAKEL